VVAIEVALSIAVSGALLGILLLLRGQLLDAAIAAFFGMGILTTWVRGIPEFRRGVGIGLILAAILVGTYMISQWPWRPVTPPFVDWMAAWLVIGWAGIFVTSAGQGAKKAQPTPIVLRLAPIPIVLASALACCGWGVIVGDENGRLRFDTRPTDVLPLPPTLRLLSSDMTASCGNGGSCVAEFVIVSADAASSSETADRVAAHLRDRGWPLTGDRDNDCVSVGLLPWRPHCIWLDTDPSRGTVTIIIGNL
jgi:hypothetical protein